MIHDGQPIRILVVDDSAFMRNMLSMMLMKCPDLQVVGTAKNGQDAIEQAKRTQPDVMTLDIEMPGMNGLEVLDHMMRQHPLPIIMVSALTEEGAVVTLQALERGAVDFLAKPINQTVSEIQVMEKLLHGKVYEAFQARHHLSRIEPVDNRWESPVNHASPTLGDPVRSLSCRGVRKKRSQNYSSATVGQAEFPRVVVGASTGGPNILKTIVQDLPASFPAALLIVQHMPKYFTKVFAEKLDAVAAIPIVEAQDGDELRPGVGFVVPGNHHVVITREVHGQPQIRFAPDSLELPYRPSIDHAMISAAEQFGQLTVGMILSGMGDDGMVGSQTIQARGGTVLVQDEGTSLIFGMPRAVVETGMADVVLPDVQLAAALAQALDSMCSVQEPE